MNWREIINSDLCISCGACEYISSRKIKMVENECKGIYLPTCSASLSVDEEQVFNKICPANGYPIIALSDKIHYEAFLYDYRVGKYISIFAAQSCSEVVLEKASSGGIMTELAMYLLNNNIVQGVVATLFEYEGVKIVPKTKIFTVANDLLKTQGSKYMPVSALSVLDEISKFDGQVAYIGTPCQIACIRLLQNEILFFKEKIKYTIGNFCGGFKDMRELYRLKKIANMQNEIISEFQYRGNGQPGYMLFTSTNNKHWEYPYPKYDNLTGYMKYYRCRVCIDATAELADVSCGDAWLPKFKEMGGNWSIVLIRNSNLSKILNNMHNSSYIRKETILLEELIISQKQNLNSKKERYVGRAHFLMKIGKNVPKYDGGWNVNKKTSFLFETKVYFTQVAKQWLELCGLYSVTNKWIRKIFNK